MKNIIICFIFLALLSACATGSSIVIGKKRPPVDPSTVKILHKRPDSAVLIGIVKARSLGGVTDQSREDYALNELKNQAAKLGANAVLLLNSRTEVTNNTTFISNGYGGGTLVPHQSRQADFSAMAIYVPPKK